MRADKKLQKEKEKLKAANLNPEELSDKLFQAYKHMLDNRMEYMKKFVDDLLRID